ncbi:MAG: hypothetical protein FWE21_06520 [Defluviitaleaceae bacterium]|nr:hypothetical protein [Defluviitaleaceae bacterium]
MDKYLVYPLFSVDVPKRRQPILGILQSRDVDFLFWCRFHPIKPSYEKLGIKGFSTSAKQVILGG